MRRRRSFHRPSLVILGALLWTLSQGAVHAQAPAAQPVLIEFSQQPGNAEQNLVRSVGGEIKYTYRIVPVIAASIPTTAIDALNRNPNVTRIEPDFILHADVTPNDPQLGGQWSLNNTGQTGGTSDADIDAPEAWEITTGSSSVVVAVLDTGAQVEPGFTGGVPTHPDLAANLWVNTGEVAGDFIDNDGNGYIDDVYGWNFYDNAPWVFYSSSEDQHGTHVSGTIAAAGNNGLGVTGVNWQARLMVLKFIGPFGGYTSDAIAGIQYAADNGAEVINASWGGGGFSQALKDAIEGSGCLFVAAAGNDGVDTDASPHYPSSYVSSNLVSVAATNHNDDLAWFSNFGAASVDLGAPGESVLSTLPINTYGSFSGTSMAAPHVSGVAGLILSLFPDATAEAVKNQILSTVDPIAALAGISVTGGRLNAAAAVGGAPTEPPSPPPPSGTVQNFALSELPQDGTVSGDYTETHTSDDVYQALTEIESNGKPEKRRSQLDHRWIFDVAGGSMLTFLVEAYRADNAEGDNFAFEYSTNNSSFAPLVTVNSSTEQVYTAAIPNTVSGTVYVRVTDTDRTQGNRALDSLYVDQMYIESDGDAPPATGPTQVFVASVSYATKGGKNQNKDLQSTIALVDDLATPVGGATVSVILINWDLLALWEGAGSTGPDGTVTFTLTNAPAGLYTTGVSAIDAGGLVWDEITPDNEYLKTP